MPRVGTVALVLLSTLVGNVGALDRCDNMGALCDSTQCMNEYISDGDSYYKTTTAMSGCSCNGNVYPVFQNCDSPPSVQCYNQYMYYSCAAGKWGTSIITNTDTATGGGYPSSHRVPMSSTSQCPNSGSATCAGPAPAGPVPAGPVPSGPAPSGPAPAGPAPAADTSGSDTTTSTAVTCGDDDNICKPMVGFLPSICSCSGTNGGTGSFTECQKSFPGGYGSVGLKVELEPCDCGGAYAEVSYKVGSDWTTAGRLAHGETTKFPIPGMTFGDAGLYAEVAISGDKSSLVVDVHLSACIGGSCNADLPFGVKMLLTAAGITFPIALIEDFEGVDFTEQCKCAPDCSSESSSNMGMIVGIAIAAVVVVLVIAGGVGVAMHMKKKKAASAAAGGKAQGGVALTTPSAVPLPGATPVETKV